MQLIKYKETMNKKIKSTTIYRYGSPVNKQAKESKEQGLKYSTTRFDEKGNVLEEIKFNEDGEIDDRIINTYDKNGKLIEMKNFFADDELAEHITFERNEKEQVVVSYKHYQDGEKDKVVYNYDAEGMLIEKITIDSYNEEESRENITYQAGKITQRKVVEYDELVLEENFSYSDKMQLEEHSKWSEAEEDARYVNRFDEKGRIAKILKYNLKKQLIAKTEYQYNDDDTIKEIVEEVPGEKNTTFMEYDASGNAIKQTEKNQQGEIKSIVSRKYNEANEMTESSVEVFQPGTDITNGYALEYEYSYFE